MRKLRNHSAKRRPRKSAQSSLPASSPPPAASIRALAKSLGKSATAVGKWTARADWPFGPPPWSVERIREWAAVALSPDPAAALRERLATADRGAASPAADPFQASGKRAQAELLQIIARTRLLVQEFDENAGKLHATDACQARRVRQIHVTKERLLNLPRIMAPRLAGQSRDEIERLLLVEITAACNAFAEGAP